MTPDPSLPPASREQLRQCWLAQAAAAFDRMFDPEQQDQLVTFTQREDLACDLGQELSAWLLQQHTALDPLVHPSLDQPPVCPRCGRPGQPVTQDQQPLPQRDLTTRAGPVHLERAQWRCATCRVAFFPSGPETAAGHGGL